MDVEKLEKILQDLTGQEDVKPKELFEEVVASLTEDGKELSEDFFKKGFYL